MKKLSRVSLSLFAGLLFVSAYGLWPSSADNRTRQNEQQPAAQAQTVSGKIASVDKSSFSINVTSTGATSSAPHISTTAGGPKTMSFQIDKNTTVDGQLQVGANADVTYRQESGSNIAISVHVS